MEFVYKKVWMYRVYADAFEFSITGNKKKQEGVDCRCNVKPSKKQERKKLVSFKCKHIHVLRMTKTSTETWVKNPRRSAAEEERRGNLRGDRLLLSGSLM